MRWFQRLPRALRAPRSRPGGPPGPAASRRTLTAFRIPALALLLVATGMAPGSAVTTGAPAVPVPEPWVTPAEFTDAVDPGGSTGVDKQVRTPAIPPRPDVILLVDGTASMADPIKSVQDNLPLITGKIRAEQPDSRFAVATFGDQEGDVNAGFSVLQGLTDDLDAVQAGVNKLGTALGGKSRGPSEDWINGLWQITNGAGGQTVFRDGASPVIVLVGDASSHAPSNGHSIDDTIFDLQDKGVRVIGVDVASKIGDGLNGNGDAGDPEYVEDPLTTPGQATRIINATNGRLLEGIDGDRVAEAIAEGFSNLPTNVSYRLDDCDPHLSVSLDPPTQQVTSGDTAHFAENIDVSADAPQGTRLSCTVQFLMGTQAPGTDTIGPAAAADPDFQEQINIDVNDIDAPVVTVDDLTVRAKDKNGARVTYDATAEDATDGTLPVTCTPASGSLFQVGRTAVTCSATDSAGNTGTDTAEIEVLEAPVPPSADVAMKVDVSPDRTYTGRPARARFTITNAGPDPATGVVIGSTWPKPSEGKDRSLPALPRCTAAKPCTIPAGGRIEVTQTATYRAAITGDVRATVRGTLPDRRKANNQDTDRLRVLKPSLTVTPQVAKPGQPVLARGKDYPPGATVRFTWNTGITPGGATATVGRDGTFEVQVLVLRKDKLGPRELRADSRDLARLKKPVLVVQRNLQPPDFAGRA
ncbi:HYR domain-containing protein [Streptomyces sp. NBC_01591]|uniref:HYR domain-containing protein n=1 Tax=Streptomyces sp. NBC_01591 TaxID=2975888 RepID=UPI002DDA7882|nr:HYR domain-containing protein [Streptomyces sp. NBC_01591]WSD69685.1 HYR domain-containing protein [Streptomyces sp. NBC_01591]